MGDVPGAVVCRDLTGVELILQRDLHCISSEGDVCEGSLFGVDAANACDHEVCFGEVEEGGENKGSEGGGGVDFRLASCELADGGGGEAVDLGKEGGEAWDGDVIGEQVANGARSLGIFVPNLAFGVKLEDNVRRGLDEHKWGMRREHLPWI